MLQDISLNRSIAKDYKTSMIQSLICLVNPLTLCRKSLPHVINLHKCQRWRAIYPTGMTFSHFKVYLVMYDVDRRYEIYTLRKNKSLIILKKGILLKLINT